MPADTVGWCLTKRYACVCKRTEPRTQLRGFFQLRLGEAAMEKFVDQQNPVFFEQAIG